MLNRQFYLRDANLVAKDLLGKLLVHNTQNGIIAGMIVELEAYMGAEDAAAHSYKNLRSSRTEVQFGEGGFAYMYLIYGMHYCFNVVTNVANKPEAILIRALEPVDGIEIMKKNRKSDNLINLCNGPGKLCSALEINKSHYGIDLCGNELHIDAYQNVANENIVATPRVNIDYAGEAKDYLWRYYIKGNKFVSKPSTKKVKSI